jgi:tetratricopeptide (TPR) repeat protein
MHIGRPDEALKVLHRSSAIKYDPWVVAAEIAISSTIDRSSHHIKRGRQLIEAGSAGQFHLSELACALGTIEMRDGARKKGKRLFELALIDPTENTLAQAASLKDELGDVGASIRIGERTHSFEAETRLKFSGEDFLGALDSAKKWLAYQPFSASPAVAGSYIAAVALCEYEDSVKFAKIGLISSPNDVSLKNNLAFSLASLGDIEAARRVLREILDSEATESQKNTLMATRGLIEFRDGNMQEGRRLYSAAAEYFKRQKDYRSEVIAVFFWAREEALSRTPFAESLLSHALSSAEKMGLSELLAASKAMPPLI